MENKNFLQDIIDKITDTIPDHLKNIKKDWQKTIYSILANGLDKLEVVTREEFDTQAKVLARTRKKLDSLAKKIEELEGTIKNKSRTKK